MQGGKIYLKRKWETRNESIKEEKSRKSRRERKTWETQTEKQGKMN